MLNAFNLSDADVGFARCAGYVRCVEHPTHVRDVHVKCDKCVERVDLSNAVSYATVCKHVSVYSICVMLLVC